MHPSFAWSIPLIAVFAASASGLESSGSVRLSIGLAPGFNDVTFEYTDGSTLKGTLSPEASLGMTIGGRYCMFFGEEKPIGLVFGLDGIINNQSARWERDSSTGGHSVEKSSVTNLGLQGVVGAVVRINAKTQVEWTIGGGGGSALSPTHTGDYDGYSSGNGHYDYALKDGSFTTYGSALGAYYRLAKGFELGVVFDYTVFSSKMDAEDSYVASDSIKSEKWTGQGLGARISMGAQF